MRRLLSSFFFLLCLVPVSAQTVAKNVQKAADGTNAITESLTFGSGKTLSGAGTFDFSSGTLTLPASLTGGGTSLVRRDALGSNVYTWLGTPSSANLAAALTDETGSGSLVFATSPTLTTPNIGAATGTSLTGTSDLTLNAADSSRVVKVGTTGGLEFPTVAGKAVKVVTRSDGQGYTFKTTTSTDITQSIYKAWYDSSANNQAGAIVIETLDSAAGAYAPAGWYVRSVSTTAGAMASDAWFTVTTGGVSQQALYYSPSILSFSNPNKPRPTNFEELRLDWSSNIARIFTNYSGSGVSGRTLQLGGAGSTQLQLDGTGLAPITDNDSSTGSLGVAANRWYRAYIADRLVLGNTTSQAGLFYARSSSGNAITVDSTSGALTTDSVMTLRPGTAPASPSSGWTLYVDSGDGNKLKAKASTGTVVTLGTP